MAPTNFTKRIGFLVLASTVFICLFGTGYFLSVGISESDNNLVVKFSELVYVIVLIIIGCFTGLIRDFFTDKNEFTHDKVMEIISAVNQGRAVSQDKVKVI